MQAQYLAASVVLAFAGALCTASCGQDAATAERDDSCADAPATTSAEDGPVGEAQGDDAGSPPLARFLDAEPLGEAEQPMLSLLYRYQAKDFSFVVVKDWDGEDGAGGEQRALQDFHFDVYRWLRVIYHFNCPVDISMAVQSRTKGHIGTNRAALVTAEVANEAIGAMADSRDDWDKLGALFCIELRDKMNEMFRRAEHKGYGARVKPWLP